MRLTERAHGLIGDVLRPGDLAIDATAGNGHDTVFLCECVGLTGRVFAFDCQQAALTSTQRRVQAASIELGRLALVHSDHAQIASHVPEDLAGHVAAIVFNLGYLPGGDKSITTTVASTLAAVAAAESLVRENGIITVMAYPGHSAGRDELVALEAFFGSTTSRLSWREVGRRAEADDTSPRLFVARGQPR